MTGTNPSDSGGASTGSSPSSASNEVSLDDIDSLLAAEDPEFSQSLEQIRSVGPEASVEIESAVGDVEEGASDEGSGDESEEAKPSRLTRIPILGRVFKILSPKWLQLRAGVYRRWLLLRAKSWGFIFGVGQWLRHRPGQMARATGQKISVAQKFLARHWHQFQGLSLLRQTALVIFTLAVILVMGVFLLNLKGQWIPFLEEPPLMSLTRVADGIEPVEPGIQYQSFLKAFPQEKFGYLFKSVVVNLKRTRSAQNPMGYFEFYVELDSQDAAIEAQQREKELSDAMQRTLEGLTYSEVQGPVGRQRMKDLLRQRLNEALNHGWAKEVFIKNVVLKP